MKLLADVAYRPTSQATVERSSRALEEMLMECRGYKVSRHSLNNVLLTEFLNDSETNNIAINPISLSGRLLN